MYASHLRLAVACRPTWRRRRVDAVVVPTVRPEDHLRPAVELARELGAPVLLLCSDHARAASAAGLLRETPGATAYLQAFPTRPILDLPTLQPASWTSMPYVDTARKRNVAILVARMLGWRRIVLLDDDIFGISARDVEQMAAVMVRRGLGAIGWRVTDFPDNSTACHARRGAGLAQAVFPGAGALMIDVAGAVPFFPAVYNEDWFFNHDLVAGRRLGRAPRTAKQVPFNPFEDPGRARREEFGDVLAEGLYSLIHQRRSVLAGCLPSYWSAVVDDRRRMLTGTEERLWRSRETRSRTPEGFEIRQVIGSVEASLSALESVTPDSLAGFTSQWRFDLFRWRARLHRLPAFTQVKPALQWLGVKDVHVVGDL